MESACRNATEEPSEANLVKLLDLWSAGWKHRGRTRAVGPGAYERYATLGLFGHGGVVGVSNATGLREACIAVNRFLKSRFPDGTWTSIAVLFNPRMGLHRDIQNMPGHWNHALALGEYTGWIFEDADPQLDKILIAHCFDHKQGSKIRIIDFCKSCSFNLTTGVPKSTVFHGVEFIAAFLLLAMRDPSSYKQYAINRSDRDVLRIEGSKIAQRSTV
ncbi:hypothetical protein AK812_SmicGene43188 [Symbiodinium microadriaticum]|uniref:Uncharacterized protein n=1 Tax=Symbiodinium microadriaticum TaxID=2951 RepID=A0A1Q9C1N4_SYMMI|nr:hypothetical protein AK812_SmicGene43188 [Symbiodinium microadriaticum]